MSTGTLEFLIVVLFNLLAYWRKDIMLYTPAGLATIFYGLYFTTLDGRVDMFFIGGCVIVFGYYSIYKAGMRVWRKEEDQL